MFRRPLPDSTVHENRVHSDGREAGKTCDEYVASRFGLLNATCEDREIGPLLEEVGVGDESQRTKLIDELTRLIREPSMPEATRTAGLTLIGWLARRMPGERAHALGVTEARQSAARIRASRQKAR